MKHNCNNVDTMCMVSNDAHVCQNRKTTQIEEKFSCSSIQYSTKHVCYIACIVYFIVLNAFPRCGNLYFDSWCVMRQLRFCIDSDTICIVLIYYISSHNTSWNNPYKISIVCICMNDYLSKSISEYIPSYNATLLYSTSTRYKLNCLNT